MDKSLGLLVIPHFGKHLVLWEALFKDCQLGVCGVDGDSELTIVSRRRRIRFLLVEAQWMGLLG